MDPETPRYKKGLAYGAAFVSLHVPECVLCGALVGDQEAHDAFHESMNQTAQVAARADRDAGMMRPLGGR